MRETADLTIDGIHVKVPKGTTILEAAKRVGIDIPTICYHPNLTAYGLCRICSVDGGYNRQLAACVTICENGMNISTKNDEVSRTRKTILELLESTVDLEDSAEILEMLDHYQCKTGRFSEGDTRTPPIIDDNPFYIRDYSKCINCWRCVQICGEDGQFAYALSFENRGFDTLISTFLNDGLMKTTCVFCGQCVGVCPTNALKPKRQDLMEEGKTPDEIISIIRDIRKSTLKAKDS